MSQKKFYRIFSKRSYSDSEGNNQDAWYAIGYLKLFPNDSGYLRLYQHPNDDYVIQPPHADGENALTDIH